MPEQTRVVSPGPGVRSVRTDAGEILHPPADWVLVPPGDPALTRRLKAAGPSWAVREKKGRKVFSLGVWAHGPTVEAIKKDLDAERANPRYAAKQAAAAHRRQHVQADYVRAFRQAVFDYLAFPPRHEAVARRTAEVVADHATPVGSGTVARTERIPIGQRRGRRRRLDAAPDQRVRPDGDPPREGEAPRNPPAAGGPVQGAAGGVPGGPRHRPPGLSPATALAGAAAGAAGGASEREPFPL